MNPKVAERLGVSRQHIVEGIPHTFGVKPEQSLGKPDWVRVGLSTGFEMHGDKLHDGRHHIAPGVINVLETCFGAGNRQFRKLDHLGGLRTVEPLSQHDRERHQAVAVRAGFAPVEWSRMRVACRTAVFMLGRSLAFAARAANRSLSRSAMSRSTASSSKSRTAPAFSVATYSRICSSYVLRFLRGFVGSDSSA
ncbi:hypothetical protein B0G73_14022 [Paraburkholderia sp. BL25I1N1]|nr:hypothetical protein B0G73_14022 [Paraburkholderia sp. BL25I1N1]